MVVWGGFGEGFERVLGGFWEGFGRVLKGFREGFGRVFGKIFGTFWMDLGRRTIIRATKGKSIDR